jgi:hypothetical protein
VASGNPARADDPGEPRHHGVAAPEHIGGLVDRLINGSTVVFVWAGFNAVYTLILIGFTTTGFVGGAGGAGIQGFLMYAVFTVLIALVGVVVWRGGRRRKGLRVPPRPAVALLLAVAVGMAWLGFALGNWLSMLAAGAFLAAMILEFYPRPRP